LEPCKFVAQFDTMRLTKDGGKLILEFSRDQANEIISKMHAWEEKNLAVVIVPFKESQTHPDDWSKIDI